MDVKTAVKEVLRVYAEMHLPENLANPSFLSERMEILSHYLGLLDVHLAGFERDLETETALKLKHYLVDDSMKVTQAEKMVKIETAELKAKVTYLSRIVASGWKQVGVLQSRINHLTAEWNLKS